MNLRRTCAESLPEQGDLSLEESCCVLAQWKRAGVIEEQILKIQLGGRTTKKTEKKKPSLIGGVCLRAFAVFSRAEIDSVDSRTMRLER